LLSVSISKSTEEQSAKYDISLAKLYLPTLTEVMKSTIVQKRANDIYASKGKTGTVSTGAVSIDYNEDGLIFSMAYSDESEQACQDKLTAFIEASTLELEENGSDYFHAQEFLLTPTKNNYVITSSDNLMKYIVVGVGAGLVFSVLIVFLIYLLDNKVKTPTELEELTGSSLLAYIEKDPE
jgi:capsular polysaccharide biosynthesis protein